MVHGLFSFPHTGRYENDVLLCAGNDANRTAEKFLHNSIQFLLNPNGECLCQAEAEMTETKRGGLQTVMEEEGLKIEWETMAEWRPHGWPPGRYRQRWEWRFRALERKQSGRTFEKKKGFVMITSDRSDILRKANSFSLIASLRHLTQHLQRNSLSAQRLLRILLPLRPV